jgi:prophage antirepressor-like protein
MSQALQTFSFNESPVRVLDREGGPWWVAADVCRALDIQNPSDAVATLDGDDLATTEVIDSLGRRQTVNVISESGLYNLIFASRKPEAKAFKRWVTHEVLPTIRKTGRYELGEATATEQAEWDLEEVFALARRGAEQLLETKPLNASGASALALLIQECRKIYELRFRIAPPVNALPDGRYDTTADMAAVLCMVASGLDGGVETRLRLSDLWAAALARGLCGDIVEGASITTMGAKAFGRRLQALRGRMLTDEQGRQFQVRHHRTKAGALYVFQFNGEPME